MGNLIIYWLDAAIPPLVLAFGAWLLRNVLLVDIPDDLTLRELMRLEVVTGSVAVTIGIIIAVILGLSFLGFSVFGFNCFYNLLALPSVLIVASIISYRTIPITRSNLKDCLILGLLEVWLGITASAGLAFLIQVPGFLSAGAFFGFLTLGAILGLTFRILIYYLRGV